MGKKLDTRKFTKQLDVEEWPKVKPRKIADRKVIISLTSFDWGKSTGKKLSKRIPYHKGYEYPTILEEQRTYELKEPESASLEYEPQVAKLPLRSLRIESSSYLLDHIEKEIAESKYIPELKDGWNDENSKEISRELYDSTVRFLRTYAKFLCDELNVVINAPEINPCADGSIDLSWQTEQTRMLINFKIKERTPFAFYFGDNFGKKPVKGNIPALEFEESLAVWMKKLA